MRVYIDRTFELESRGLIWRNSIYTGTMKIKKDTIEFQYTDSIPKIGNKAILTENRIIYFDGMYQERLELRKNKLVSDGKNKSFSDY